MTKTQKITKKGVVFTLAIALAAGGAAMSVSASAKTKSGKCGKNIKWTLTDKGALTIKGKGAMKNYSICDDQPWANRTVKSVTVKSGVTSIGDNAFAYTKINKVKLPATLKKIGEDAFWHCDSMKKINIPKNVTKIQDGAFEECGNLRTVTIPKKVKSVGVLAFSDCGKLSKVIVLNAKTKLGDASFGFCKSLKTVKLPKAIAKKKTLLFNVFENTPWMKTHQPKSGKCGKNLKWKLNTKTGTLTLSGKGAMYNYSKKPAPWYKESIKSVVIKSGTTTVGDSAFEWCANLKKASFPKKGLTKIGNRAFCTTSITNITIPKSVKTIGTCAVGYREYHTGYPQRQSLTIKGYAKSAAQKYAKKNGFKFGQLKK